MSPLTSYPSHCGSSIHCESQHVCTSTNETATAMSHVVDVAEDALVAPEPLHIRDRHVDYANIGDNLNLHTGPISSSYSPNENGDSSEHPPYETLIKEPERFWLRCSAAFFALFTAGWADGMTGTILPHLKKDFTLSYMTSSLLFITSTFGFALGVIMIEQVMHFLGTFKPDCIWFQSVSGTHNIKITRKMAQTTTSVIPEAESNKLKIYSPSRARFRILVIASILHASFFVIMGTATGLSNVLAAYFVASLGKAFLNGTVNAYVAASPKRPLGQLYACNSIGAFAAPFVCQTLLARGVPWAHFYLGSLVLSVINTTLLALAFRPTRNDRIEEGSRTSSLNGSCTEAQLQAGGAITGPTEKEGRVTMNRSSTVMSEKTLTSSSWSPPPSLAAKRDPSSLRSVIRLRYVWAFSFFMCIYSGSETSTQGYMATYLLAVRNANPNTVGYVTSGFWGGMAITRAITGFVSPYLSFTQRKHTIHLILILALSMHLCIWFINSVFENAFSTGVIGLLYGPVYPSVLALTVDLLPSETHMITMAIIAAFANLGSSIFPFIAGALSNVRGPKVLVYITVAQTVTLIILWMFFPTKTHLRR